MYPSFFFWGGGGCWYQSPHLCSFFAVHQFMSSFWPGQAAPVTQHRFCYKKRSTKKLAKVQFYVTICDKIMQNPLLCYYNNNNDNNNNNNNIYICIIYYITDQILTGKNTLIYTKDIFFLHLSIISQLYPHDIPIRMAAHQLPGINEDLQPPGLSLGMGGGPLGSWRKKHGGFKEQHQLGLDLPSGKLTVGPWQLSGLED